MALELSGPPGGGKTAIAVGIALSARLGRRKQTADVEGEVNGEEAGEVLIIGKLKLKGSMCNR